MTTMMTTTTMMMMMMTMMRRTRRMTTMTVVPWMPPDGCPWHKAPVQHLCSPTPSAHSSHVFRPGRGRCLCVSVHLVWQG